MIFAHTWELILAGRKTQTRRIVKPEHEYEILNPGGMCVYVRYMRGLPLPHQMVARKKIIFQVGKTYAIQTGYRGKTIGRIRILDIDRHSLQDITEIDAEAEGCLPMYSTIAPAYPVVRTARDCFADRWNTVHKLEGRRWEDNPLVWVLTHELVSGVTHTVSI